MSALTQVVVFLSNERIAIFFQFAVRLIAGFAAAAVSPVSAQSVEPTLACVAPPGFARFDTPLERVAARISARQPITIVAIGSSSTFGTGASSSAMSYPSRLAVELRALLPQTPVTVINRGVNGETAQPLASCHEHVPARCLAERRELAVAPVCTEMYGPPPDPSTPGSGERRGNRLMLPQSV
jgi:hypothetical protein